MLEYLFYNLKIYRCKATEFGSVSIVFNFISLLLFIFIQHIHTFFHSLYLFILDVSAYLPVKKEYKIYNFTIKWKVLNR